MDLIPTFIEGKKNARSIKYLHPDLKPILEETYGVLVYQEQVLEIAKTKFQDMNSSSLETAARVIAGTARSMGIEVID